MIFSRSTIFAFFCTFGVEVEKAMENHLVDPTKKAENAESSEDVETEKRYQKYTTCILLHLWNRTCILLNLWHRSKVRKLAKLEKKIQEKIK